MSQELLAGLIVIPTAMVVVVLFLVLWRERTSARTAGVAVASGIVLAAWAGLTVWLASRGFYLQPDGEAPPAVGIQLLLALAGVALLLAISPSLRSLLTNQRNLIRLNVWRLLGVVFLALTLTRQVPALWAIPTGLGDMLIGTAAFPIAAGLALPGGMRRAVIFNWLGLADLVDAVGLGVTTSPGPLQVFHTVPTSELVSHFPLALVPGFLVPLAIMLHIISLWQLAGLPWAREQTSRKPPVVGGRVEADLRAFNE